MRWSTTGVVERTPRRATADSIQGPGASVGHGSIMPSYARRVETPMTVAFVGYADADRADAASAFEDEVLPLLGDHGADLLYRGRRADGQDPSLPLEVHLIRFPGRRAYDAFLADERRRTLVDQHGEVFASTIVVALETRSETSR